MKYIKINRANCDYAINVKRIDCIAHYINDDGEDIIKMFLSGSDNPIIVNGYTLESILYLIENAQKGKK